MTAARTSSLVLIVIGCALPVVAYLVARIGLSTLSARGGPPDQGAMVVAYFSVLTSIAVGLLMIAIGAGIFVWAHRTSTLRNK